jgi:short-subunit dehydrogenase
MLRERGKGGVINVASAAGFTAAPRMAAYNVSKAGVVSLSETLAAELAGTGVAVTVLVPTFVRTNIFAGELIDAEAARLARRIAGLAGFSPERVARLTLDAHDKGRLYALPQLDAKALWRLKRLAPAPYARVAGLVGRFAPEPDVEHEETS